MQIPMDPNDLESFFLNKDKKKKSKKVYTINPATLLEQTREQELKKAKKVIEKHQQSQEPKSELLRKTKEDDEWEDAPDIEVDISNLRIGMMPQKTEDAKPQSKTDNIDCKHSDESDSDNARRPDKSAHPWGQRPVAKPLELGEVAAEPQQPQQPAKYVPPSQRGGDASRGAARTAKKAPNIANSVEFPSLREMADVETDNADGSWCRVIKNGHSTAAASSSSSSATVAGSQSSSDQTAKKYIPSAESSFPAAAVSQSATSNSADKPAKYVPPHLRNRAAASHSANENRFAALKDEANN